MSTSRALPKLSIESYSTEQLSKSPLASEKHTTGKRTTPRRDIGLPTPPKLDLEGGTGCSRGSASPRKLNISGNDYTDDSEGFGPHKDDNPESGMRSSHERQPDCHERVHEENRPSSQMADSSTSESIKNDNALSPNVKSPITIPQAPKSPPKPDRPNPVLEIFVWSRLPDTMALICKRRLHQNLLQVRQAWLARNSSVMTQDVRDRIFLINNQRMRLYDVTTPASLGIEVNEATGEVYIRGRESESLSGGIHGDTDDAKVWMEAVTAESLNEIEQAEKAEKARKANAAREREEANMPNNEEKANEAEQRIGVIMRAKGYEEWKVRVKPVGLR